MDDRASPPAPAPAPAAQQETTDAPVKVKEEPSSPLSPSASVAPDSKAPSMSPSRTIRQRTAAQRQACLRRDPLVQEMEPHRVQCRGCQKWIKLASSTEYTLNNWEQHKTRCRGSSLAPQPVRRAPSKPSFGPSSRVATAERKIVLLNDPQVKDFSQGHVQCGTCKTVVALESEVEYDLTKWTAHKKECIPVTPAPISAQGSKPRGIPPHSTSSTHSQVSAPGSARSPTPADQDSPNSHPSENTAVASGSPAAAKVGVKRARETETDEEEQGERPTNRPRTTAYEPSLFGWLMQPLKEFARGFREGLGST